MATGQEKVTQYEYDDYGNLTRETDSGFDASGTALTPRVTNYAYNGPFHQLSQVDGPRTDVNDVTTYDYDAQGNLIKVTDALGHVTTITSYDALDRPLSITDPNGLVTQLAYDTLGRLLSRNVGGEITAFTYDPAGNLTRSTLPDGSYLDYTYDGAQRLVGIADQLGNRIAYTLDTRGDRVEEDRHDPNNTLTMTLSRVYNDLNKLIKKVGAQGQITAYGYDASGNRNQVTGPLSHTTTYYYDAYNRLYTVANALTATAAVYSHDLQGDLTQVQDADRHQTQYVYDDFGDVTQVTSPDAGATTYTYDGAGNVATKTDAKGDTTTYAYDALSRLTGVSYADGTTATYTYDNAANGIGHLVALDDSTGHTQWSYDLHGRVLDKQQTVGAVTLATHYSYDSYGRLAEMVYPSGNTVDYSYTDGRISALSVNGQPLISDVKYQPFGPVNAWIWGNGTQYTRQYDLDGRLTNLSMPGDTRTLTYDLANRVSALSDVNNNVTFGYDAIDRLTQVTGGPADQMFQYSLNGSRLKLTQGSSVTTYSYVSGTNRLSSYNGPNPKTYTYDADGSPTGDGVHTYIYDARNRLVAVDGGTTATYAINDLGQRVRKTALVSEQPGDANGDGAIDSADFTLVLNVILQQATPTGDADCNRDNQVNVQDLVCINQAIASGTSQSDIETNFVYDEHDEMIGEYDAQGNPIEDTVYFNGMPVATVQSHAVYYVYSDHLGAPRAITNTANTVLWRWDSTAFGETAPNEDADGDGNRFAYNLRFPGQYSDQETGLYYNYFRDYDPGAGRYVESDPMGLRGSLNTYSYVANDPANFIDPRGLWSFSLGAYLGIGGAFLIGQDPTTGQWFYGGRLGIGLGGGGSLDLNGKRPGDTSGSSCGHGTTYGDFINLGGSVGPAQWDPIDAHGGYDTTTGHGYSEGPLNNHPTIGFGGGVEIGGSFGIEIVGH